MSEENSERRSLALSNARETLKRLEGIDVVKGRPPKTLDELQRDFIYSNNMSHEDRQRMERLEAEEKARHAESMSPKPCPVVHAFAQEPKIDVKLLEGRETERATLRVRSETRQLTLEEAAQLDDLDAMAFFDEIAKLINAAPTTHKAFADMATMIVAMRSATFGMYREKFRALEARIAALEGAEKREPKT